MRSLVLIISLLFAFASTQGQGAMFLRGSQPAPQPGAGILDNYLGAAFAAAPDVLIYSAHSVTDNTVGSQTEGQTGQYTVLVRRDNDDALRSFTYTEVSDGTLTTWVGPANNGFVQILYDQGTNGNHATQGTAASQPKIVDAGSLVVENGKAALDFDGVDDWLFAPWTFPTGDILTTTFFVCMTRTSSAFEAPVSINPSIYEPDRRILSVAAGSTSTLAIRLSGGNTIFDATSAFDQSLFCVYRTAPNTDFFARQNATQLTVSSSSTTKNLNIQEDSAFMLGASGASAYTNPDNYFDGTLQISVWYLSDNSSNVAAIETIINNEYNIY